VFVTVGVASGPCCCAASGMCPCARLPAASRHATLVSSRGIGISMRMSIWDITVGGDELAMRALQPCGAGSGLLACLLACLPACMWRTGRRFQLGSVCSPDMRCYACVFSGEITQEEYDAERERLLGKKTPSGQGQGGAAADVMPQHAPCMRFDASTRAPIPADHVYRNVLCVAANRLVVCVCCRGEARS